jgi:hypothetical protein
MRFWKLARQFLRWDSRIFFGVVLGLVALSFASALADVVHFHNGKTLRGKLTSVTGELIEFKPSFFRSQTFTRLTLTNNQDVVEMKNFQKYFGRVIYADNWQVAIVTSSGRMNLNRFLVRNIVLGSPGQPPVELPQAGKPEEARAMPAQGIVSPDTSPMIPSLPSSRIPLQSSTFLFPPSTTPAEDLDAINTDDRLP